MPDQAFAIDEHLYRRLGRRFEPELALWGASDDIHMVMIATFGVSSAGVPAIVELSLMPVTRHWLPVEDGFEKQLLDRLVGENRAFVKGLHYNLARGNGIASAVLTDCEGSAPMLFIVPADLDETVPGHETRDPGPTVWMWRRSGEPMPPFPLARTRSPRPTAAAHGERTPQPASAERP
jgi:hypothetical protein